jgi:hypothetical protein
MQEAPVMSSAKHPVVIAIFVMVLTYCGCPFFTPNVEAEISELTLCQDWDDDGNPVVLPDVVPPDETRICVCGHIETNVDLYLHVLWYRDGTSIAENLQMFNNGPFTSCIENEEGFEPGDYTMVIMRVKKPWASVEFSVAEGQ